MDAVAALLTALVGVLLLLLLIVSLVVVLALAVLAVAIVAFQFVARKLTGAGAPVLAGTLFVDGVPLPEFEVALTTAKEPHRPLMSRVCRRGVFVLQDVPKEPLIMWIQWANSGEPYGRLKLNWKSPNGVCFGDIEAAQPKREQTTTGATDTITYTVAPPKIDGMWATFAGIEVGGELAWSDGGVERLRPFKHWLDENPWTFEVKVDNPLGESRDYRVRGAVN